MTNAIFPTVNISTVTNPPLTTGDVRSLIIGQKVSALSPNAGLPNPNIIGTAATKTLIEVPTLPEDIFTLFGFKSPLAHMIRHFRKVNPVTPLYAIAYDESDLDGVVAPFSFTITPAGGPASVDSKIKIWLGGNETDVEFASTNPSRDNWVTTITIPSGSTAADVANLIALGINSVLTAPVTATEAAGVVTVLAPVGGVVGNGQAFKIDFTQPDGSEIPDFTFAISAPTQGTGTLDLSAIDAILGNKLRFHTIVTSGEYLSEAFSTSIKNRFSTSNKLLDGGLYVGKTATATSLFGLSPHTAYNNEFLQICVDDKVDTLSATPIAQYGAAYLNNTDFAAAQLAGTVALRETVGADLSNSVISSQPGDLVGSPALASLPLANTRVVDFVPAGNLGFNDEEVEMLKNAGFTVYGNNLNNTEVVFTDVITTYAFDEQGVPDPTFKFTNAVITTSTCKELIYNFVYQRYSQTRMNANIPGYAGVTQASFKSDMSELYSILASYALVRNDRASRQVFQDGLADLVFKPAQGEIDAKLILPLVTQFRKLTLVLQPVLTVPGDNL